MHQIFSIIAAAGALTVPQTGIVMNAPVTVSACTVSSLYNPATTADLGLSIPTNILALSFRNTDETVATQVTFDVAHDGTHSIVIDRGRFSPGVTIDHIFAGPAGFSDGAASCAVARIAFADGHVWTAPRAGQQ
jgi:hypothetical protein